MSLHRAGVLFGRRLASSRPSITTPSLLLSHRNLTASTPMHSDLIKTLGHPSEDKPLVTTQLYDDGVAIITLNNPDKLNAMTVDLGENFMSSVEALKNIHSDDRTALRAVVLTGAGRAFSAGGDMKFLKDRSKTDALTNSDVMRQFYARFLCIRSLDVPTIAAINGPAIGAGLCVAGACDLRICATDAKMGWTFAGLGLHPGMAATHYTSMLIGPQNAAKYLLTGRVFTGVEALQMGLVVDAVDSSAVVPAAMSLARDIAKQSSVAVQSTVRTLRDTQDVGLTKALAREADCQAHNYASTDLLEGIAAIQERRKPNFNAKL